jgi:hypothetical protein
VTEPEGRGTADERFRAEVRAWLAASLAGRDLTCCTSRPRQVIASALALIAFFASISAEVVSDGSAEYP